MEILLLSNIKKLYDNELYSSVIPLASFLESAYRNDDLAFTATPDQKYQLLLFEANAHYYERNFRLASEYFAESITTRKGLIKQKSQQLTAIENTYDHFSEIETKYRLAVCYKELKQFKSAISLLQSIPNKCRTAKINMLIGKLQPNGVPNSEATLAFKDVLRECPLALEAIKSLLEIGVDGAEVNSLIINLSSSQKNIEWLNSWIRGHAQLYARKHLNASETFRSILETTKLHNNEYILSVIGQCLYYNGNYDAAVNYLDQAHSLRPNILEPLMPLAVIYAKKNKMEELQKLTMATTNLAEFTSEHWFVLAQSLYAGGKLEKASYFAQKSIFMNPRNAEAFILRGIIFYELKRYCEAISCYLAAQSVANYRFEVYKGFVQCYLAMERTKEAQATASHAVKCFHRSPRSHVLLARILALKNNEPGRKTAKNLLARALEYDENYFPAVVSLAEILQAEGDTAGALRLLRKQSVGHPNCKLFTMLGDILRIEKDLDGALEYYTIALSMEPTNQRALDGVNALGQSSRPGAKQDESSLVASTTQEEESWEIDYDDPSIEAVEFSPNAIPTVDPESETETVWSDVDIVDN